LGKLSKVAYGLEEMRVFAIVAVLIALLVTVYLITRDTASRMSEKEDQLKITAIEKAREAETKIDQTNKAAQKRLKEIQND
jgi:uncharacterized membrane protein